MSQTTKKKTTVFIHSYNSGSESAKALAKGLEGKRILTGGRSKFKYGKDKTVINWGSSDYHVEKDVPMFNPPERVATASNKLTFFEALKSSTCRLVPFTTSEEEVQKWIDAGSIVVARQKLTGHSGEGIVIIDPNNEKELDIVPAKMYTKYVKKAREYRIHIMNGEVIRVQKKILQPEMTAKINDPEDSMTKDDIDWSVRNHGNGFIYVTDGVEEDCPKDVIDQATKAISACRLHFGAVDVIWNNKKQQAFVLEINTSPGLQGGTIDAYLEGFDKLLSTVSPEDALNALPNNPYTALDFSKFQISNEEYFFKWSEDNNRGIGSIFAWPPTAQKIRAQVNEDFLPNYFPRSESPQRYPEEFEQVRLFMEAFQAYASR